MRSTGQLGAIVVDEIIFRIVRIRLGEHEGRGCFLLDAETELGDHDFAGGEADCEVFGEDGRSILHVKLQVRNAFRTRLGVAYMTLPVHITETAAA